MRKYLLIIPIFLLLSIIYFTNLYQNPKKVLPQVVETKVLPKVVEVVMPHFKSPFCKPEYTDMATSTGSTYTNTYFKFSIKVPAGWNIPTAENEDPHFGNCEKKDGFEISNTSSYEIMYREYLHPRDTKTINIYKNLIPGAIVREYYFIDPEGDGWPHWVDIIFINEKVSFYFGSENQVEHYPFLSTFKLIK